MDVLIVSHSRHMGGAERILLDMAAGLGRCSVACPPGPLLEEAEAAGLDARALERPDPPLGSSARESLGEPVRPARAAGADPVPAQLAGLRLRLRGADAGRPFRLPDRRGPRRSYYTDDASSITLWPATVYAVKTVWTAGRLVLHRAGILRSRKFLP